MAQIARRITVLKPRPDGTLAAQEISKDKKKKRKVTKGLSLIEKVARTAANVNATAGEQYLERHKKSNRKKKDGWIKDAPVNIIRSGLKGAKKIKLSTFF